MTCTSLLYINGTWFAMWSVIRHGINLTLNTFPLWSNLLIYTDPFSLPCITHNAIRLPAVVVGISWKFHLNWKEATQWCFILTRLSSRLARIRTNKLLNTTSLSVISSSPLLKSPRFPPLTSRRLTQTRITCLFFNLQLRGERCL